MPIIAPAPAYRGRVRSGCLTCRARKVKCDEARPVCVKCQRLDRECVYKPRKGQARGQGSSHSTETSSSTSASTGTGAEEGSTAQALLSLHNESPWARSATALLSPVASPSSTVGEWPVAAPGTTHTQTSSNGPSPRQQDPPLRAHASPPHGETASPSALISRDIELTTTMDLIIARGVPGTMPGLATGPSCTDFFLREVDCPGITPFDPVNWVTAKRRAAGLAGGSQVIAEAIAAVCAVYRAQLYAVAIPGATALYDSARQMFLSILLSNAVAGAHLDEILTTAFLLCLAELVHIDGPYGRENGPVLMECDLLASRLGDWLASAGKTVLSPLSTRLVAWLRIIHRITLRGGGTGLVSDRIYGALCRLHGEEDQAGQHDDNHDETDSEASPEDMLHQALGGPLFDFYYHLQLLSGHVARLTHYHRSRLTADDQDAVAARIAAIRSSLHALWASTGTGDVGRMTIYGGLDAAALRSQLAPEVAQRLVTLMRLCEAAYHAEIVELDRVLGDPVQRYSSESRASVRAVMGLVDACVQEQQQDQQEATRLSPGFLRPLFLCAIETIDDHRQTAWAVRRMEEIRDPVYRSDFFAAFGAALADAQQRKERRVTSRYFCLWFFGVSPPFM
ncbi:hypothetical protein Micbo1qcDRAFT_221940 [Microdochium bolleyi]|uniref:Zn(2)-C6 fungal-type domain-containing protein n=1 Tax=Microdochium bolleyi TaxID=196109 RepID=A0A136ILV1_9PEZI|nr:hypothetical protein Micbo1qcDRAFT_221940 [Microdochium bolleyi]